MWHRNSKAGRNSEILLSEIKRSIDEFYYKQVYWTAVSYLSSCMSVDAGQFLLDEEERRKKKRDKDEVL